MSEQDGAAPDKAEEQGRFSLRMTEDNLSVLLNGQIEPAAETDAERRIRERLLSMGISDETRLAEAAAQFRAALQVSNTFDNVPLLTGKAPRQPKDAEILWSRDFFTEGFMVNDETGQINYRERASKRAVTQGLLLAKVMPAEPGEDGVDVLGRRIKVRPPRRAPLRAGRNVTHVEADNSFVADMAGQVRYQGELLHVDDIVQIPGSVDLSTGNIHHPGSLRIAGNIESGTVVEAAGDIDVHGMVGDARIVSHGGLSVQGGITGGEHCVIRIAGELQAHYIQHADIEAEGNVVAESEIIQCRIKTRGCVIVTQGRMVGGETMALQGVQVDQVGSEGTAKTEVRVGQDYALKERLGNREAVVAENTKKLEQISQRLAPFRARAGAIPPKLKDTVLALLQEMKHLQEENHVLEGEAEEIRAESKSRAKREVVIRKLILPDAHFHLHPQDIWVREKLSGPLRIYLKDQKVRIARLRGEGRKLVDDGEEIQAPEPGH